MSLILCCLDKISLRLSFLFFVFIFCANLDAKEFKCSNFLSHYSFSLITQKPLSYQSRSGDRIIWHSHNLVRPPMGISLPQFNRILWRIKNEPYFSNIEAIVFLGSRVNHLFGHRPKDNSDLDVLVFFKEPNKTRANGKQVLRKLLVDELSGNRLGENDGDLLSIGTAADGTLLSAVFPKAKDMFDFRILLNPPRTPFGGSHVEMTIAQNILLTRMPFYQYKPYDQFLADARALRDRVESGEVLDEPLDSWIPNGMSKIKHEYTQVQGLSGIVDRQSVIVFLGEANSGLITTELYGRGYRNFIYVGEQPFDLHGTRNGAWLREYSEKFENDMTALEIQRKYSY